MQDQGRTISKNWKHWLSQLGLKTCQDCRTMHGKIYPMRKLLIKRPPLHLFCHCKIKPMEAIVAGRATRNGTSGADYWIKYYHTLPNQYITKAEARKKDWIAKNGNLNSVLPGKVIGGDIFRNDDGHLPDAPGRVWYEADIDYISGYRGIGRLLFSNDGLIFVSYDHYQTYMEVT